MFELLAIIILSIYVFSIKEIRNRDSSHGIWHFWKVCWNVRRILNYMTPYEYEELMQLQQYNIRPLWVLYASAMCHDINDHKYNTNHNYIKILIKFMSIKEVKIVEQIVSNVSFSNEIKNKMKDLGKYNILLYIVQSADRIEAIGDIGLNRCLIYGNHVNPNMSDIETYNRIYDHCKEKLLLIRPYFIHNKAAQRLIDDNNYHKVIEEFCDI